MSTFLLGAALFLLVNVAVGLLRVLRGPTAADRMLAAQLFGTTGIAIILLLAVAGGESAALDVALVFALLAVVTVLTFVHRFQRANGAGQEEEP